MEKVALHYGVVEKDARQLLPLVRPLLGDFYLAGGTGLALQLGHRYSRDFDFFTTHAFDPESLYQQCQRLLQHFALEMVQHDKNTLSIIIQHKVKISFFTYPYPLLKPCVVGDNIQVAHALDIGAMKITALLRATYRDYVDLYFLLQQYRLDDLMQACKKKYKNFDAGIYLKCLLAYDDVELTPVRFVRGRAVSQQMVFNFLRRTTRTYIQSIGAEPEPIT